MLLRSALCASFLVLGGLGSGFAAEPDIIPEPELAVGDWWEVSTARAERRWTVVERQGDGYVLVRSGIGKTVKSGAGKARYFSDADGVPTRGEDASGKALSIAEKHEWVRFPLVIGGRWVFSLRHTSSGATKALHRYSFACQAAKWEETTTGSRTTRAVRIECVQRNDAGVLSGSHTVWYSPEAKRVVKLTSDYVRGPGFEVTAWNVRTDAASAVTPSAVVLTVPPPVDRGSVEILRDTTWSKVASGARIGEGDKLRVAAGGAAEVRLPDGSVIHIAENTRVTLTRLRFGGDANHRNVGVHLVTGKIRADVARRQTSPDAPRAGSFFVSSPNVVSSVREGLVVMSFTPSAAATFVAASPSPEPASTPSPVTVITPANGVAATMSGGHFTTATAAQPPVAPALLSTLPADFVASLHTSRNSIVSDLLNTTE